MGNTALDKAISMRRSGCMRLLRKFQQADPDSLLFDSSGDSHRSSSGTDTKTSQSQNYQEVGNSKASRDSSNSRVAPSENSPSDGSKPFNKSDENDESLVENSESEVSFEEVDLSLVEIYLDKEIDELPCEAPCSVTEYEDDDTTAAWSRAPWMKKVDCGALAVFGLIAFLFVMLAILAVGIARIHRGGSSSTPGTGNLRTWAPTPSPSQAMLMDSVKPTLVSTMRDTTPSPSVDKSERKRLPWIGRVAQAPTSSPSASLQKTDATTDSPVIGATTYPTTPPTSAMRFSTNSPVSSPTHQPSALPTLTPTTKPSASPTVAPTGYPSSIPTKRPVAAQAPASGPNFLWGRGE